MHRVTSSLCDTRTISSWVSNIGWTLSDALELRERIGKFGLGLHPEKTRLIEFGRYAAERRSKAGLSKPETFSFLGFTHYCGETGKGAFTIKRQSMAKRIRAKLLEIKTQLKRHMHRTVAEMGAWLRSVVRGWLNYHAIPGNSLSLGRFPKRGGPYLVWRVATAQSEVSPPGLAIHGTADSLLAPSRAHFASVSKRATGRQMNPR